MGEIALLERGVLGGRDEVGAADEEAGRMWAQVVSRAVRRGYGVRRVQLCVGVGGGDGEVAGEGFGAEADGRRSPRPTVPAWSVRASASVRAERAWSATSSEISSETPSTSAAANSGQVPFGERAVVALEGDQGGDANRPVHRPVGDEEFVDQRVWLCGIHEAPSPR